MNHHYTMEELLPIVAKLAEQYTAGESTSVTYEKAEQLMGAVIYCIQEGEYPELEESGHEACMCEADLAEQNDITPVQKKTGGHDIMPMQEKRISHDITSVYAKSARQAYEEGLVHVQEKVKAALALYNELLPQFDSYGNRCLYDTFVKGMPEFFKWYDIKYAPQDTILTLDYPVCRDLTAYSGIDRIYEYLRCIRSEQEFLGRFPRENVLDALSRYHPMYEDMIDNICEPVRMSLSI